MYVCMYYYYFNGLVNIAQYANRILEATEPLSFSWDATLSAI